MPGLKYMKYVKLAFKRTVVKEVIGMEQEIIQLHECWLRRASALLRMAIPVGVKLVALYANQGVEIRCTGLPII